MKLFINTLALAATLICVGNPASAMPVKSQMLRSGAFFIEGDNNLFQPLDLKEKSLSFTQADFDQCGASMMRKAQTLTYNCTLPIPSNAKISKVKNVVSSTKITVKFGGTLREVTIAINADARAMTLSTTFDRTGIDFEMTKFNDDFFAVYAKVAQLVITEALARQSIRVEVLESRNF